MPGCDNTLSLLLRATNQQVNAHSYDPGNYICKHYVEDKIERLHAAGIPYRAMRVVYGITYEEEQHVILRVDYGGEIYFLDNRTDRIDAKPHIAIAMTFASDGPEWAIILAGH